MNLIAISVLLWMGLASVVFAEPVWTLERSVERAVAVAPELAAAQAAIDARGAAAQELRTWANPRAGVRADNRMGKDDGRGGYDATALTLMQPLAHDRAARREAATALVAEAQAQRAAERLALEREVAVAFHDVQLRHAQLALAEERLATTQALIAPRSRARDPLVRVLTPLERLRVQLLAATAEQAVANAEGEQAEALSRLSLRLQKPPAELRVVASTAAPELPTLPELDARLNSHPALAGLSQGEAAARAEVGVARAQRWADPAVQLFYERDVLADRRQTVTGVGFEVGLPLWNAGKAAIAQAQANVSRTQALREAQRRDLVTDLAKSYTHYSHLREQAQNFRERLLVPAEQVLARTRRAFASGETNLIAFIDASNAHFDAHSQYLQLLHDAWVEAAEVRAAAGVSLLEVRS